MTFNCLSIMRPTSRHYPTVYSLVLFVLVAYCCCCVWQWQQHKLDLDHLKGTAASEYVNINEAKDSLRQLGVENLPTPSATHSTKVSYVTSFWAKVIGEEINPHRREVEAALLANIHNPHFDQVVVYLDREEDNAESCLDFCQAMSDLSRQVFSMTAEESNELLANK
eukprot:scaffold2943_cov166-Skeletonema_dohrnii-CCMP3373.AAC.1